MIVPPAQHHRLHMLHLAAKFVYVSISINISISISINISINISISIDSNKLIIILILSCLSLFCYHHPPSNHHRCHHHHYFFGHEIGTVEDDMLYTFPINLVTNYLISHKFKYFFL